jgi:hypothetical protein
VILPHDASELPMLVTQRIQLGLGHDSFVLKIANNLLVLPPGLDRHPRRINSAGRRLRSVRREGDLDSNGHGFPHIVFVLWLATVQASSEQVIRT